MTWCADGAAQVLGAGTCETEHAGFVLVVRAEDRSAGVGATQEFIYGKQTGALDAIAVELWHEEVCAGDAAVAAGEVCVPTTMLDCTTGRLNPTRDMRDSGGMR